MTYLSSFFASVAPVLGRSSLTRTGNRVWPLMALGLWLSACAAATLAASAGSSGGTRSVVAAQKANGSGVDLSYDTPLATAPRQTVSVSLNFDGVVDPGATVRISADSSLQLESPLTALVLPLGKSQLTVRARTTAAGLFYLHVQTLQQGRASISSIPMQVGNGSAKLDSPGELKPAPSGTGMLIVIPVP